MEMNQKQKNRYFLMTAILIFNVTLAGFFGYSIGMLLVSQLSIEWEKLIWAISGALAPFGVMFVSLVGKLFGVYQY